VPFPKRPALSRSFFNELYRRGESLSILLIASNTPPEVPRVEHEVQTLSAALPDLFQAKGIRVQVTTLPSEDATYNAVLKVLNGGGYHILHYAGHGVYDGETPEESYLPFRDSGGPGGGVKPLKVPALKWALEESMVKLVYLSCCVGAAQGEPFKLQDSDFLGITDGLLQAGIPSILGYRWPVVDSGGERLAIAFYKYLAQEGETDTALLLARRELSEDREDRSWLSPVLILQA
jgi:CHAT domain-containing protein